MPRYVILEHTGTATYKPGRHFDLMLEANGRLRTWELPKIPTDGTVASAKALPDHRLEFLEFEGELTGNRGSVTRRDAGQYAVLSETAGEIVVEITGVQLLGRLTLRALRPNNGVWEGRFHAQ
jgi:hypothetical protein